MAKKDTRQDLHYTFVIIKPDGVERGLIGEIASRFERRGFIIADMKMLKPSEKLVREHYAAHEGKDFLEGVVKYMSSGNVVLIKIGGPEDVVELVRQMIGSTRPLEAPAGTIRGDLAIDVEKSVVHAPDSKEAAQREIGLWFGLPETA